MNTQNLLLKSMAILTIMPLVLISRPKDRYWRTRPQAYPTRITPPKSSVHMLRINARV